MRTIPGYTLVEHLYQGTHCNVYRAHRNERRGTEKGGGDRLESVIVKVVESGNDNRSAANSSDLPANLQKTIKHLRINAVLDIVQLSDCNVLVSEDIRGVSLQSWLASYQKRYGTAQLNDLSLLRPQLLQRLKWAMQMVEALEICHKHHVIHNSINPSNMVVNVDTQQLQLIDFDAALYSEVETDEWVVDPKWKTLEYLSPEQAGCLRHNIDYRSDFYGLGVTLYQLFSGATPFHDDDVAELLYCHIAQSAIPLSEQNSLLPEALSAVICKLMAKVPEDRYQNARCIIDDLKRIYGAVSSGADLAVDQLVQNDIPETLYLPHKLYGRCVEIQQMTRWLSKSAVILVDGVAGIGKTALVQESLQNLGPQRRLLLTGKFEQYQRLSHEGLVQAINCIADNVAAIFTEPRARHLSQETLPQETLPPSRRELTAILGQEDSALLSLCPRLKELLISDDAISDEEIASQITQSSGVHSPVEYSPELPSLDTFDEARSIRLKLQLTEFIGWLANQRPLMFFLDDMQWCHDSTYTLIETLIRLNHPAITFVFAYRGEELAEDHGVRALQDVAQNTMNQESYIAEGILGALQINTQKPSFIRLSTPVNVKNIYYLSLQNMSFADIELMLFDAFHIEPHKSQPLCQLIIQKTLGNPFFVREYLKVAYDQSSEALYFDQEQGQWRWDIAVLKGVAATGNVIDVLLYSLKRLPPSTQTLLQWAACFGKGIGLSILSGLSNMSEEAVNEALAPAIRQGLIQRTKEVGIGLPNTEEVWQVKKRSFQFTHDRVQQAIYEQLAPASAAQHHFLIAQTLEKEGLVLQSLPHLVVALNDIVIRQQLTQTCLRQYLSYLQYGADSVMATKDTKSSLLYLSTALLLIEKAECFSQQQLSDVLLSLAEVEYRAGHIVDAEHHFDRYQQTVFEGSKKALGYFRQMTVVASGKEPQRIVPLGIQALRCLGVLLPRLESDFSLLAAQEKDTLLKRMSNNLLFEVASQPLDTDADQLLTQRLFERVISYSTLTVSVQFGEYVISRAINYLLTNGCTAVSPSLLTSYAVIEMCKKNYASSEQLARQAVALVEKHGLSGDGIVKSYYGGMLGRYFLPYDECIRFIDDVEIENRRLGDDAFIVINQSHRLNLSFMQGVSLHNLKTQSEEISRFSNLYGNMLGGGLHYWRLIEALINPGAPNYFERAYFSDDEWIVCNNTRVSLFVKYLSASRLFWLNQFDAFVGRLDELCSLMEEIKDLPIYDEFQFIRVIGTLQYEPAGATGVKDTEIVLNELQSAIDHVNTIAELCPENFRHYALLIKAEIERVTQKTGAPAFYYQASEVAKKNGVEPIYALAQELQGAYWKGRGREEYAHLHFANAVQGYSAWGGKAKVQLMESLYGHSLSFKRAPINSTLSSNIFSSNSFSNSVTDISDWQSSSTAGIATNSTAISSAMSSTMSSTMSIPLTSMDSHSSARSASLLDNISYLKVANAIAEEMELTALMLQIVRVVLENVGAEKGYLLLKQNSHFQLYAQAKTESDGIYATEVEDADNTTNPTLTPNSIIHYCAQNRRPVLLDNAQEDHRFSGDEYFRGQRVKSLICFPIIHKDNVRAIFVLVNNSVSSVFTQQHLQFMNTLAPQFAVSIENALLYQQLIMFNKNLENTIAHRTEELKAANEELQAFSSSVSHDLKAPLRAISGLSLALKEDYSDELPDEGLEYIQHVCDASERMGHIIDGLLMLSRSTQSELTWDETDLSQLVNEKLQWLHNVEPERPVKLSIQKGVMVDGDAQLLHQVIENLLSNAWKYSQNNPQAHIEFGQLETERNPITYFVRDNGAGFDAASASDIFQPFRRYHSPSEFEGSGIGLATVYRIIKRHGGELWVDSEPGKGATFYFTLTGSDVA